MVKFKLKNKGLFTQGFAANPKIYNTLKLPGHTGIDTVKGWDAIIEFDNDGLVYKVFNAGQSRDNWRGVYQIVHESGDNYVEVCMGHFNEIFVNEGDYVVERQFAGKEGNKGFVFTGGIQITKEMQDAGDKRAHHVHTSTRPVIRKMIKEKGKYYLLNRNGTIFRDKDGYCYEIRDTNDFKGYVDPLIYRHENSLMEDALAIGKLITHRLIK